MKHQYILGLSAGFHDAATTLIRGDGEIVFAGHSERYSKKKNDAMICPELMTEFCDYEIDTIAYYERPWAKQARQWYAGQGVEWDKLTTKQILRKQLDCQIEPKRVHSYNHHLSHAAAGFQTSPFERATIVVIDAIGEWDTISIWGATYDSNGIAKYKRLWRQIYPHSIGLFYSAVTKRIGLHPLDEEYITMGMAAWGRNTWYYDMREHVIADERDIRLKQNFHTGMSEDFLIGSSNENIAAAAQLVAEDLIRQVMIRARNMGFSQNLVYMGGVALNCTANRMLGEYFDKIWIMPCPGDAGSSLGCAALVLGRRINWRNSYLGHCIPGVYPVNQLLDRLLSDKIVGVASGRAEFGPRALGNRSLLADPRGSEIKEKVNAIKRRQQFRPFAPVILAEVADDYFDMPAGWHHSPYMQSVARCRQPDLSPAVCHVDGTSRVQTVAKDGSGIRELLEKWYVLTGCPMLLNTSLNIRGEPMVNDRADADRFEQLYGVKVYS